MTVRSASSWRHLTGTLGAGCRAVLQLIDDAARIGIGHVFGLVAHREIRLRGLTQNADLVAVLFDQPHKTESVKPVAHRPMPPTRGENISVPQDAVQVMDRGHAVIVILVVYFRPLHPVDRDAPFLKRAAKVGILASIAVILLVEATAVDPVRHGQGEIQRPEAALRRSHWPRPRCGRPPREARHPGG